MYFAIAVLPSVPAEGYLTEWSEGYVLCSLFVLYPAAEEDCSGKSIYPCSQFH